MESHRYVFGVQDINLSDPYCDLQSLPSHQSGAAQGPATTAEKHMFWSPLQLPSTFGLAHLSLTNAFRKIFYKMLAYANLSFKTIPSIKPKTHKRPRSLGANWECQMTKVGRDLVSANRVQSLSSLSHLSRGVECNCFVLQPKSCACAHAYKRARTRTHACTRRSSSRSIRQGSFSKKLALKLT